ncbi:MAG: Clp protease N-terminal domain-containing protein [Candidatus Dormibacteria bacterium]
MADHKDLKRLIRARMRKTGESYTSTRAQILKAHTAPGGKPAEVQPAEQVAPPASQSSPDTGQGMYPFQRFTEHAKKVLTLAQSEAERSHHGYIGTEHVLLGLLREKEGVASHVLTSLGVEFDKVHATIESVLGRTKSIPIQQIIPTSRVKQAIEISFAEARRMGSKYVGTEHLLLGVLVEGQGIAAHVLEDMGADLKTVRREITRLRHDTPAPSVAPGAAVPASGDVHLLLALLASDGPAGRILREAGLSPEFVRERVRELEG